MKKTTRKLFTASTCMTPDDCNYELAMVHEALEFVKEVLYRNGCETDNKQDISVGIGYLIGLLSDRTWEIASEMPNFQLIDNK